MSQEYSEDNLLENVDIGFGKTTSFDELYGLLKTSGAISGTSKMYNPEEMIKEIERVRHGHRDIGYITRSYELRKTVSRLLENDPVHRKYVANKQG